MPNKFDTPVLRELRAVFNEADELTGKAELSKRDEARVNVLLAKIAALRANTPVNSEMEAGRRWMRDFIKGREVEQRGNLLAGGVTLAWTQGVPGGYLVPTEFADNLLLGAAQFDPLLDDEVVTVIRSKDFSLRPLRVPAWDLSTIAATKVNEAAQQVTGAVPAALSAALGSYTYRQTLAASFEFEDDDFQPVIDQINIAYAIAFARGIGVDLVNGNGTTAPQGVLTAAANSTYTTVTTGVLTLPDVDAIYFAVDAAYRAQPKCAWVMNDATYKIVRNAVDSSNRPLLDVIHDPQELMGKPVYISPSMPGGAASKGIVFGDLSHYVVHVSQPAIQRTLQAAGYVDAGLGLYTGLLRADAKLVDPTGGTKPPIVYATLR